MKGRDLLWDTLSGKKTNRIPVAPFIFNNIVNEALGGPPDDPIAACVSLYKKYGFDILLRNYFVTDYMDESCISCKTWQVESKITGDKESDWNEKTVITTPERKLSQVKSYRRISPYEVVEAITEYYIKDEEDFEQFKKFQPPIGLCDCSKITHAKRIVGEDGLTGPWVQGAFNIVGTYRDLSELLMDPYTDDVFYADMMEYFLERLLGFMRQVIKAGADFISMSGNMASGSMAGPRMFSEYVMPYEIRIISEIHRNGAKIIYHNCGDAKELLPLYNDMQIDMYESLTAAPYGDTVLEDAIKTIKLPTALSGGIDQIDFLRTASPEQIDAKVKQVMDIVKNRGGFVLAASDYINEGTPEANLFALAEAGRKYGVVTE